jgi:hypothetical protein
VNLTSGTGNVDVPVINAGRDVSISAGQNVILGTVTAAKIVTADAAGGDLTADSITADAVNLSALGSILVPGHTINVSSWMNLGADRIIAVVNHTGSQGLLQANAMDRDGSGASLIDLTISSPVGVRFGTFWTVNGNMLLPSGGLEIGRGLIDNRATIVNPDTFLLIDQRGFQLQAADIQLFTHKGAPFQLKLYGRTAHIDAWAIQYNELTHNVISLIPGVEPDVRKNVQRVLAIAEDLAEQPAQRQNDAEREDQALVTFTGTPVALPE